MNELPWPPTYRATDDRQSASTSQSTSGSGGDLTKSDNLVPQNISDLKVMVGDSHSKFRFSVSKYSKLQASQKRDQAQSPQSAPSVPQTSPPVIQQNTADDTNAKCGIPLSSTGTQKTSNEKPEHQAYPVEAKSV